MRFFTRSKNHISIDQWFEFYSPLSKTGVVFLLLIVLLTMISFLKGIQVLMFVSGFIVSLFTISLWDYWFSKKNIKIFSQTKEKRHTLVMKQKPDGYFYKIAVFQNNIWKFLPLSKNRLQWDIPKNTEKIKILASGRFSIFQRFIPIPFDTNVFQEQKKAQKQQNILLEIREYENGDMLENIDPKKSMLGEKIFLRQKTYPQEVVQKKEKTGEILSIHSDQFLTKFRSIHTAFSMEWVLITLGFIGVFLEWGGVIFPLFFLCSIFFVLYFNKNTSKKTLPFHKKFLNPIALILFFGAVVEGFLSLNTVLSGAHFLLSLAVWKHAFPRERRDGFTYIFLILFVFIALSLYTLSAWFLFLFLLFLLLSAFLLSAFSGGEVPEEYSSRFGTPYTSAFFIRYFFLLLFLTFFFFLVLPHGNSAKDTTDLLGKKQGSQTGFSENVSLDAVGSIKESFGKKIVIENANIEQQAFYKTLYWRGARFNEFDGKQWKKVSEKNKPFFSLPTQHYTKKDFETIALKIYAKGQKNIFLPFRPVGIQKENIITVSNDETIFSLKKEAQSAFFLDVTFEKNTQTGQWRETGTLPSSLPKYCTENTCILTQNINKIFGPFWSNIPNDIQNSPEKLSQYIQNKFSYSLTNPAKDMNDFLYGSQQGHCEYFATTLAVTLQHFGFTNTTLVNGFYGGEWNEQAKAWVVRNQNAHSWVEIFDTQQKKWIRVDPTPSFSQEEDIRWYQKNRISSFFIQLYDSIELKWNKFFVEFTGDQQKEFFLWIFSFWKFYLGIFFVFFVAKYSLWYRKNIFLPHSQKTEKEKFFMWITTFLLQHQKKDLQQTPEHFSLDGYKIYFPVLVLKTQQFLFGKIENKTNTQDEKRTIQTLKNEWKKAIQQKKTTS